jgi:hypothetical protein
MPPHSLHLPQWSKLLPLMARQAKCVLFGVLAKMWLVNPDGGLEACRWEWCGWMDHGVSAAGQVVRLYIRSSRRLSLSLAGEVVALNAPSPKTIKLCYP